MDIQTLRRQAWTAHEDGNLLAFQESLSDEDREKLLASFRADVDKVVQAWGPMREALIQIANSLVKVFGEILADPAVQVFLKKQNGRERYERQFKNRGKRLLTNGRKGIN